MFNLFWTGRLDPDKTNELLEDPRDAFRARLLRASAERTAERELLAELAEEVLRRRESIFGSVAC